jgi:hypothetical protein
VESASPPPRGRPALPPPSSPASTLGGAPVAAPNST